MKNKYHTPIAVASFLSLIVLGLFPANAQSLKTEPISRKSQRSYDRTGRYGRCYRAMSQQQFWQKKRKVECTRGPQRLQIAQRVAHNNCLNSRQVKLMAQVFRRDHNRFEFAKTAFRSTVDRRNFDVVFPTFRDRSYVRRLKRAINYRGGGSGDSGNGGGSCGGGGGYGSGSGGSSGALIGNRDYQQVYQNISRQRFTCDRFSTAKNLFQTKRKKFAVHQIRRIAQLFWSESSRMQFVKFAYDYAHRKRNYHQLTSLFKFSSNRQELLRFIKRRQRP